MRSHKILIVGQTGQIARGLAGLAWWPKATLTFASRKQIDLSDATSVKAAVTARQWSLIINCAAYTDVDAAEDNQALAFAINESGPKVLAETACRQGVPLIHISTDYVFDGTK